MKKFLIGCTAFVLVIMLLLVGGAIFVGVKVKNFGTSVSQSSASIEKLNKDYPFVAPATPTLAPERLTKYFQIRSELWQKLSTDKGFTDFYSKISAAKTSGQEPDLGIGEMLALANSAKEIFGDVGDILRKNEMSPSEYQYITQQIYGTLVEGKKLNLDISTKTLDAIEDMVDSTPAGQNSGKGTFDELLAPALTGFVASDDIPSAESILAPYLDQLMNDKMHFLDLIIAGIKKNTGRNGAVSYTIGGETIDLPPPAEPIQAEDEAAE